MLNKHLWLMIVLKHHIMQCFNLQKRLNHFELGSRYIYQELFICNAT
jgi:hypothetical protein